MSEQKTFKLTVAIICDTKEQAEEVAAGITLEEPDYGFDYHLGDPQLTEVQL